MNCGHTIGHALETLSHYEIPHGQAVAMGIVLESQISYEMGLLKKQALEQIKERFPSVALSFDSEEILEVLSTDKKASARHPRFVLLQDIGVPMEYEGAYCAEVPPEIITKVLYDAALCPC